MSGDDEATEPARRVLGERYVLRTRLGSGSMGVVWAGYDELLCRPVAVKEVRLPPGMPDEEADALRERTLREARAIAALSHPNVITVYDVVQEDGAPFVVMELMVGSSLAAILRSRGGPLLPAQSAAVADAIAAGLEAAHRVGITHRDVKPGNVLVGEDDQIKLTDFGIARNVSDKTMTQSGVILGSPAFMAPEVAAGKPVTAAADLWGLGATLYAAACGHAPYDVHGDVLATLMRVVHDDVPAAGGAGELEPVIRALMVKDPAARTDLVEVRRAIYRMLPEPGERVFPVAERVIELLPEEAEPELPPAVPPASAPDDADEHPSDGMPLAADPGPLPFFLGGGDSPAADTVGGDQQPEPAGDERTTRELEPAPHEPHRPVYQPPAFGPDGASNQLPDEPWHPPVTPTRPRRRRGRLATATLVLVCLVLFGCAAGGGFALSRTLAGMPLRAEPAGGQIPRYLADDLPPLQRTRGNATNVSGDIGTQFSVRVPQGWTMFLAQRTVGALPTGTVAHYVSDDGARSIAVERIPDCYPAHSIAGYRDAIPGRTGPPPSPLNEPGLGTQVDGPEEAAQLFYRTDGGAGSFQGRANYSYALPVGNDLWVVTVSVPVRQEDSGKDLFVDVARSFTPAL